MPFRRLLPVCLALFTPLLHAQAVPARLQFGDVRGFVVIRSAAGKLIGNGEYTQQLHDGRVAIELDLRFLDGSRDEERSVFTQHRTLDFVSDHHIQQGPFFSHPTDLTVEADGNVTVRTPADHGQSKVETSHINLPPGMANGFIAETLLNVPPGAGPFKLAMVAPSGKGRLLALDVSRQGKAQYRIAGQRRTATVFRLHPNLGGIAGFIAPILGKQPLDAYAWIDEGSVPVILREVAQLAEDGPVVSVELAGASFPQDEKH